MTDILIYKCFSSWKNRIWLVIGTYHWGSVNVTGSAASHHNQHPLCHIVAYKKLVNNMENSKPFTKLFFPSSDLLTTKLTSHKMFFVFLSISVLPQTNFPFKIHISWNQCSTYSTLVSNLNFHLFSIQTIL